MVQPQEKYEHIGEEIKMMDLLADVYACLCACWRRLCVCLSSADFSPSTIAALFSFMWMSFLNCTSRIVLSACNCAPPFAVSLGVRCVCERGGKTARWRERPKLQAVWGSREPLEIAGRGTDKAASHSSGQMKAVKLTGGTQASPQDGCRPLSGDLWLTHASRHGVRVHTHK